jgi:hypothetical protein
MEQGQQDHRRSCGYPGRGGVEMQYTEQEKMEFKAQFSARRRNQLVLVVPMVAILLLLVLLDGKQEVFGIPLRIAGPGAIGLMLVGVVFSYRNWRCPACNKYLGKDISPKFCSKCGVDLT